MGESREKYPEIVLTEEERTREELLKRLGQSFQKLMEAQGNACALKGGTAMRFGTGLPRPSTDLDFEGDRRIAVRKTIQQAVAAAFPGRKRRVGWDWLRRGTVRITIDDAQGGDPIEATIDYRVAGSRPSIPTRIDTGSCRRVHGMNVYKDRELAERKLNTVIGDRPRQKPRDLYDTGWLVHERPELISKDSAMKLKAWMNGLSADRKARLRREMQAGRVIARCDVDKAWRLLEEGITRLIAFAIVLSVTLNSQAIA